MNSMKLNEAEMASVYGGKRVEQGYACATTCGPCYEGQDAAKEAYKENCCRIDRNFGT